MSFKLLQHQKLLLQKCRDLEKGDVIFSENETMNTKIGILGDKSGSGKSFVMLALACESNPPKTEMYRYIAENIITIKIHSNTNIAPGPSVFVVHHNLMRQWKENVQIYNKDIKVVYLAKKYDLETINPLDNFQVVFLSSSLYSQFCNLYNTICFKRVFIDEADTILLNSQVIHASFHWFVTSSYKNLINPHGIQKYNNELNQYVGVAQGIKCGGFIKDLFTYLHDKNDILKYVVVKNDDSLVDQSFSLKNTIVNIVKCKNKLSLRMCHQRSSLENIIQQCNPSMLTNIRERISSSDVCPICFEQINEKAILLCCANIFCIDCIGKWLMNVKACPTCRSNKTIDDVKIFELTNRENNHIMTENNNQIVNFVNILNDPGATKILIFAGYDSIFNNIIPHLVLANISYSFLKGSASRQERIVDNYNDITKRSVIFLDQSYYGSGLNLHETTDVVFFNKFDNEIEKKIIGSAQRFGRETPLRVWYFIPKDETSIIN